MAYTSYQHSAPFYRPKKLPRVLRRQAPVLLLCGVVIVIGLIAIAVTWRNLSFERLTWDIGHNRASIESLNKEIQHLSSQIEVETSYARISRWAQKNRGWKAIPDQNRTFAIHESSLNPTARQEAQLLGDLKHE